MAQASLKPSVPRRWLFKLAGFLWAAVGTGLCLAAVCWLSPLPLEKASILAGFGLTLAALFQPAVFRRVRDKNIERIRLLPESVCVFAFQAWKSYFLVLFMMALGATLRHSPVPKPALAVLYLMIGGSLLASSFRYFSESPG